MRLLERPTTASVPGHQAGQSFRLRSRADGRSIDLPQGKTTIGSSARCNLRLQGAGVQPLHCLIVHEAEGLSVRRWGGDAFLNGQPFQESMLSPGDCLRVATFELEVVAPESPRPTAQPEQPARTDLGADDRLRRGRDLARSRSRKLVTALRQAKAGHERELQQRIAELQHRIESAAADRERVAAELNTALSELADFRRQHTETRARTADQHDLAAQNERLGGEVRDLTERVQRLSDELAAVDAAKNSFADESSALAEECRKLREENSQLRHQDAERDQQFTALSHERGQLREQNEKLQADLQAVGQDKSTLGEERSTLCNERNELRERLERVEAELQSVTAERKSLAEERTALRGECDELCLQIDRVGAERQQAAAENESLAGERKALCDDRDKLRERVERLEAGLRSVTEENKSLAAERTALGNECDELRGQVQRLGAELRSVENEKTLLADERQDFCRERDELRDQIDRLRAEIQSLAAERSAHAEEHEVLCGERDGYRHQFKNLREKFDELAAEKAALADERAALCGQRDELRVENEKLQSDLRAVADEKAALAEERADLHDQRDQLRGENEQLQASIAELDEEVRALTNANSAFQEERDRLREENQRFADVERQMRAAVVDRENTSAELYRALLQAAEMQQQVDQFDALAGAHQSLLEQHDQLAEQLTKLQEETNRSSHERGDAAAAQQALADEAAAVTKKCQQLADENAELVASLSEAREQLDLAAQQNADNVAQLRQANESLSQQLEEALRHDASSAQTAAASEVELAALRQAHAAAETALAEAGQLIADQEQRLVQFTGAIKRLEDELEAAREAQSVLASDEDEWQRLRSEAERLQANQAQRIAELEAEIAAMEADRRYVNSRDDEPFAVKNAPDLESPAAGPSDLQNEVESPSPSIGEAMIRELQDAERIVQLEQELPRDEIVTDDSTAAEEENEQVHEARSAGRGPEENSDPLPIAANLAAAQSQASPASVAPPQAVETTSYIERYAHLFAEDGSASEPAPPAAGRQWTENAGQTPRNVSSTPSLADSAHDSPEDEESIEQYMNKLLQRVRGQSAGPVELRSSHAGAAANKPGDQAPVRPAAATPNMPDLTAGNFTWIPKVDAARHKSGTPAPKTDLEALRALANETARRAISRHAVRKHRRNAVTKVIVSTLAGMTSLWLMLDSHHWASLQSLTACGSLMVAAYWAGQTYRAFLKSLREKTIDDSQDELADLDAGIVAPLPIDIDTPTTSDSK